MNAEVWIIHAKHQVLVTEFPGPPAEICGYMSKEAEAEAKAGGYPLISEIGFPRECWLGAYETPTFGWGKAGEIAEEKAKELGYEVDYQPIFSEEEDDS